MKFLRRLSVLLLLSLCGAAFAASPTYVSNSGLATSGGGTVITAPASIQDGDILVAHIIAAAGTTIGISGFTSKLAEDAANFGVRRVLLWKRASSESGNYTITGDTGGSYAFISVYRGAIASGDPIDVVDGEDKTNSGTTLSAGALTPSVNETLFAIAALVNDATSISGYTGGSLTWTERLDAATTLTTALATAPQATAGAVTGGYTLDSGTGFANILVYAVAPAAGGGGGGSNAPRAMHYKRHMN
jgi:hypothetical protein